MDHAHSQPSDALQFIHELRRAINDNPKGAAEVLEQDAQLWVELKRFLERIPAPADQTLPCEEVNIPIRTEQERLREELGNHLFDNSTPDEKKHLREALENFLALFETPKQPPRDDIHTTVDNSPSNSTEIDPIIPNDGHDSNAAESDRSEVAVLSPSLPRLSVLSSRVSPTPMNGGNKSALVIEYNESLSRMFTAFLKSDHYLVRTAYESEDALRLYRDCGPFQVVLIDYRMPTKNGIDIALDILKQDPTQPMIIIAPDYRSEDEVPRRKELMGVPFLLDMRNSRLQKVLDKLQPRATREEVDRAITALTTADLLRLRKFGEWRVCLSRGTDHRTWEDLLQEALCLTFEGAEGGGNGRHWNKRVPFVNYLVGVMRSITRRRKGDIALWCDIFEYDAEGQGHCLLDTEISPEIAADQLLIEGETCDRIFEQLKDYPTALFVAHGLSEGLKTNEIMKEGGLSENEYRAAVRRIRMKLLGPTNGGDGGEKLDGQN
jgi:CheY-like chemotaxis protein